MYCYLRQMSIRCDDDSGRHLVFSNGASLVWADHTYASCTNTAIQLQQLQYASLHFLFTHWIPCASFTLPKNLLNVQKCCILCLTFTLLSTRRSWYQYLWKIKKWRFIDTFCIWDMAHANLTQIHCTLKLWKKIKAHT